MEKCRIECSSAVDVAVVFYFYLTFSLFFFKDVENDNKIKREKLMVGTGEKKISKIKKKQKKLWKTKKTNWISEQKVEFVWRIFLLNKNYFHVYLESIEITTTALKQILNSFFSRFYKNQLQQQTFAFFVFFFFFLFFCFVNKNIW